MTPAKPDPLGDESLLGRIFLLLSAVLRFGVASTDAALLPGEFSGKRRGNAKLLGIAVSTAHRRGWIAPCPAQRGARLAAKSGRKFRNSGAVVLWMQTETTVAGLELVRRQLTRRPHTGDLFKDLDL